MDRTHDQATTQQHLPDEAPPAAPKKRFQFVKIQERPVSQAPVATKSHSGSGGSSGISGGTLSTIY